jgi:hypothetical protein
LDDINVSNEMVKEHMLTLSLNPKVAEQFAAIAPGTKANFTRKYNSAHQAIVRLKKTLPKESPDSEEEDEAVGLDEEELREIKEAKRKEKEQAKAARAMKRIEKLQKITEVPVTKLKKVVGTNKRKGKAKKSKKGNKGKKKGWSDEESLHESDSLNEFIVEDEVSE